MVNPFFAEEMHMRQQAEPERVSYLDGIDEEVGGTGVSPVSLLIFIAVTLGIFKVLGESESTGIEPAHLQIGAYNILSIGFIASLFIILSKMIFGSFYVRGVTETVLSL